VLKKIGKLGKVRPLAKVAGFLSRRLKVGGGTSLPGAVGLKIDPELIKHLAAELNLTSVVITATNGKTTTANMTAAVFKSLGLKLVHNSAGANLPSGVATALLKAEKSPHQIGLFEVDEAAAQQVVTQLRPKLFLVGNIFRDQLDRFGELDRTASLIGEAVKALPKNSYLLLNADDPRVAALARLNQKVQPLFYGVSASVPVLAANTAAVLDSGNCPLCQKPLQYLQSYFSHLGNYTCSSCGFKRPALNFAATNVQITATGSTFVLQTPLGKTKIKLPLPAFFNVYNALAAAAIALVFGATLSEVEQSLSQFQTAFGRFETVTVGEKKICLMLIKNPTGFNQIVATLNLNPEPKSLVIAINDNLADGTDVSWLWDADLHLLGQQNLIISTGLRAEDMALRLKYVGVKAAKLMTVKKLPQAVAAGLQELKNGEQLYVLATYTAMLDLRKIIKGEVVK